MEKIWIKSYSAEVPGQIEVSALGSIADYFESAVAEFAERPAFISGAIGVSVSYRELDNLTRDLAAYRLPGSVPFRDMLSRGAATSFRPVTILPQDLAFLQYTGGTTGVSKGAMLTHRNILANVKQGQVWSDPFLDKNEELISVTAIPLHHIFALGSCLAFVGMGGAAVQRAVAERWQEITRTPLVEGDGLTECSPTVSVNPLDLKEFNGSIGLPVPSTEVSIRDANGVELPIGQAGELCVRGPQVMQGYWQRPQETADVTTEDGFLRTGDIAVMDQQGFLKIVDRIKDMILVSGFNPEALAGAEPRLQTLWLWHSAEESEHRSTAFDVYIAMGGDQRWRIRTFYFITVTFLSDVLRQTVRNLWHDRSLFQWRTWRSAARLLFARNGMIRSNYGGWRAYLAPGFHPSQSDASLSQQWLRDNGAQFEALVPAQTTAQS